LINELGTKKEGKADDKQDSEAEKKEKERLKTLIDNATAQHEAKSGTNQEKPFRNKRIRRSVQSRHAD